MRSTETSRPLTPGLGRSPRRRTAEPAGRPFPTGRPFPGSLLPPAGIPFVAAALLAAGCLLGACSGPAAPTRPATPAPPARVTAPPAGTGTAAPAKVRHLVAQAVVPEITWFATPDTAAPQGRLANPNREGVPLVFAVEERRAHWLLVQLPVRPNGSRGWLRAEDTRVTETPYDLRVDRSAHRLTVLRDGAVIARLPVGIGTGGTPTPSGRFYLTELLRPADPNGPWGPYAFGLSGFSDVITQFNGANGIIGLHGTNRPDLVGTDASHGCIRLRNADIAKLAGILPIGTPIFIGE
ncbi:L,D-transpeptidase [Frankia sp. AiPs1]|uniref:L,D-transpeptidase n=1 Tax=Frankia sp. AiPs1 TaxID=573493 RepID=UPI0020440F8E|nr:L,D-transpeptidase [Frankia sp. AiPs1]MCM3923921.1 L,D-transpeptidase [Frankia sp. AiPs1]